MPLADQPLTARGLAKSAHTGHYALAAVAEAVWPIRRCVTVSLSWLPSVVMEFAEGNNDLVLVTPPSFAEFYSEVEPRLRRALIAACGPRLGVEAAVWAMSYGFEHWDRVSMLSNPAGYLYRAGRNSVRERRRSVRLPLVDAAVADRYGFEPSLPAALMRLTERQRTAVVLVVACGWTLAEAAEVLGVSVSSVRNHLGRGMARLRVEMGAEDAK